MIDAHQHFWMIAAKTPFIAGAVGWIDIERTGALGEWRAASLDLPAGVSSNARDAILGQTAEGVYGLSR